MATVTSDDHALDVQKVWKDYKTIQNLESRNFLVEYYLPLVKRLAERISARVPQSIQLDDLCSAGVFGLIDAIDGFDMSRGIKFETYCVPRIRGAILDELREMDWVPRIERTRIRQYETAVKTLSHVNGHKRDSKVFPTAKDIGATLKTSLKDAKRIEISGNAFVPHVYPIIEIKRGEDGEGEFQKNNGGFVNLKSLQDRESLYSSREPSRKENFNELISCLTKKQKIVLILYYLENLTMREIGESLGLTEPAISIIYGKALRRIRESKAILIHRDGCLRMIKKYGENKRRIRNESLK